ncbi:plant UBX domain-containing protein 7-like [Panicum miliaceum]|uniref:Plant UBX domain-containing protein 7-like n=1 Tax=Panicum miliaceum TaxID=4540 RepID=A0A3L6QK93_PANMI|nr:plant UBX domain-containing protein 7-like [Panicum miliaceum]
MDKQMVSTFMEITSCESQADAVQHLDSCRWNLDDAINLFFSTGGGGGIEPTGWGEAEPGDGGQAGGENVYGGQFPDDAEQEDSCNNEDDGRMGSSNEEDDGQYSNTSYSDNEMNDDYEIDMEEDDSYYDASLAEDGTEDGEQPRPARRQQQNSLAEMYQLPFDLMCGGSFHDAKVRAAREDQFLLVNLQTRSGAGDFQSQLHNRDLWSDERVKNVVRGSFVFFLVQKRNSYLHLDECAKVSSFYKLEDDQLPAVLVLDPITGQLLDKRSGAMTPDEFMEYVDGYTKSKPSTMSMPKFVKRTSAPAVAGGEQERPEPAPAAEAVEQEPAAPEISAPVGASCSEQEPAVPAAETEAADDDDEPMEGETMYKLRIRLPDGTTVAKEFGCRRRVASLFAFCRSVVQGHGGGEAEQQRPFRIMRFARGGFEALQGGGGETFEDLGLKYAAVSVVFDA